MLHGVFRTKEGKLGVIALFVIMIIVVLVFALKSNEVKIQYKEQTVMAEKYLNEGNYVKAVDAYLKALTIKPDEQEELAIGLAEAYVGIKEYDKALEVLRKGYQNTAGTKIKEKIEEVTLEKTDYEYLQIISRADMYFTNGEYADAITEYEKAKLIKSKEATSYLQIAKAYIELGEYVKALEEVQEGLALTENEKLNIMLEDINQNLIKEQYEIMISDAAEYIFQENYEDGIKKYQEASRLMPSEPQAYSGLAQAYLDMEEYQKAVLLLEGAIKLSDSPELNELLNKAREAYSLFEESKLALARLYEAAGKEEADKVIEIMHSEAYREMIIADTPRFYSTAGDRNVIMNTGIIVYNGETVYCGDIFQGIRSGKGTLFLLTPDGGEQSYYYYQGDWSNDLPNGVGKTEEVVEKSISGKDHLSKTITEGTYYNSKENGIMHKYFYIDGQETSSLEYIAKDGIPVPAKDREGNPIPKDAVDKSYAIGLLYQNNKPTEKYYKVEYDTVWGVKPFLKEE